MIQTLSNGLLTQLLVLVRLNNNTSQILVRSTLCLIHYYFMVIRYVLKPPLF